MTPLLVTRLGTKIELGTDSDCDLSAMDPKQRRRHATLVRELFNSVRRVDETSTGFSFEFARSDEKLFEIAVWITLESRCCSFYSFRIDWNPRSELVQVNLSGPVSSKRIIRAYLKSMIAGRA